jgi:polysaccharide export outer membrane protein
MKLTLFIAAAAFTLLVDAVEAQTPSVTGATPPAAPATTAKPVTPPSDYVIGPGDVLSIYYRNEKDLSKDYLVRPDGKITLPHFGDVDAIGVSPEQLKDRLVTVSSKLIVNPSITVDVKTINSRKVTIIGGVAKPGQYDILGPMDVVELIAIAGSLKEYTSGKEILILRNEGGKTTTFKFNYKQVLEGKNLSQNISLKPGDRVLVPE